MPTFHKFVCNVLTVLGKRDENWVECRNIGCRFWGFTQFIFKCMFLVKLLCFLKGFFLFSLAETVVTFNKGGVGGEFKLYMYNFVKRRRVYN